MMLKANGEYLDFNDVIEVEKQIKLLEDIATTDGDFSYAFSLPKTINNIRILGNPQPDNINKQVYQRIPAILLTDGGEETFKGYLRIEKLTNIITCSVFAGNYNWFGLLSAPLRDLDWSEYDTEQNESNFSSAIFNTEGVVFPMIDNGVLGYRIVQQLKVEDFVAGIFVKSVFKKVFNAHGIKLQGELLDDAHYQSAITVSSPKNKDDLDSRSAFVRTYNSPNPDDLTWRVVQFTDDSSFPYFDGSANNFDTTTYRYTADVKMRVKAKFQVFDFMGAALPFLYNEIGIFKNGVLVKAELPVDSNLAPAIVEVNIVLEAGDYIDARVQSNTDLDISPNPITNATFTITPNYIYQAVGRNIVPDWTQQQYVSAILRRFNVLASYHEPTRTLTLNLFEKIKDKSSVDISEHISETEIDYTDFVSDYGKKSYMSDQEMEPDDDFRKLNMDVRPYSKGYLEINNEFLADQQDVLESDFTSPITYLNPVFDMSMEKTDLIDLEEEIKVEFTGVTSGTLARGRFAVEDGIFAVSDMVRIENSTIPAYNGDWMVFSVGTGWIEMGGLQFSDDATGEVSKMNFIYNDSDDVFILHHVPLYSVSNFSGRSPFKLEATDYETLGYAFYSIIDQNKQVSRDFVYSMSFAEGDQISLVEQYFKLAERVLNDPVKLYCTCTLPYYLFSQIDFLSPVIVRTEETQNVYYINRITGYKESYLDCVTELIKLP